MAKTETTESADETMEAFAERFAREFSVENGVTITADEVLRSLKRDAQKAQDDRDWQVRNRHRNPWLMDGSPLPWRYKNGEVVRIG